MNQPLPVESRKQKVAGSISTILSDKVMIPMACDCCGQETEISLHLLKTQNFYLCEHCNEIHRISATEMHVMKTLLAQKGYHFAQ